ncbi:hypothetical protein [Cellulomonas sp. NPDC058312]|uniref:hypothetical protein n=1 Tax=Cellulomonas sp. NPDC058312 TaxID=3346441 RepID=UPI0036E480C5
MNANEHYRAAEQLLDAVDYPQRVVNGWDGKTPTREDLPNGSAASWMFVSSEPETTNEAALIARAQVHATLALVAVQRPAVALNPTGKARHWGDTETSCWGEPRSSDE